MLKFVTRGMAAPRAIPPVGRWLTVCFLAIATPLGLLLAILIPYGQGPDEGAHSLRAEAMLHGEFVGHRVTRKEADGQPFVVAGVDADLALFFATAPTLPMLLDRAEDDRRRALPWSHQRSFAEITPIAVYAPFFYLPEAFAIGIEKLRGAGPYAAGHAARYANLAAFLLLGAAALLTARRGQGLIFCALTLPMTVSLAAAVSEDGLFIAASILAAALLSRGGAQAANPLAQRSYLLAAVFLMMVVTVKPPYAPLVALLVVPLGGATRRQWAARLTAVAIVAVPALAWVVFTQTFVGAAVHHPPELAGPLWPGLGDVFTLNEPARNLHVLLADPRRLITIPFGTLVHQVWVIHEIIGVLSWLSVTLPVWLYTTWLVAGVAAFVADLVGDREPGMRLHAVDIVGLLLAGLGCILAIYIAQYLSWTMTGLDRVDGVQGRYFIPLLPLVAVALPRCLPSWPGLRAALLAIPVATAALAVIVLPPLLVTSFYLR